MLLLYTAWSALAASISQSEVPPGPNILWHANDLIAVYSLHASLLLLHILLHIPLPIPDIRLPMVDRHHPSIGATTPVCVRKPLNLGETSISNATPVGLLFVTPHVGLLYLLQTSVLVLNLSQAPIIPASGRLKTPVVSGSVRCIVVASHWCSVATAVGWFFVTIADRCVTSMLGLPIPT